MIFNSQVKVSDCQRQAPTSTLKPYARWHASNWDDATQKLMDSGDNNLHSNAAVGTVTKASGAGHGATVSIEYVSGGVDDNITFPSSALPKRFTMCTLSRWTGDTQQNQIISSEVATRKFKIVNRPANKNQLDLYEVQTNNNAAWYHGHSADGVGTVAYGFDKTSLGKVQSLNLDPKDWVVVCAKNQRGARSVLVNGNLDVSDPKATARGSPGGILGINAVFDPLNPTETLPTTEDALVFPTPAPGN